MQTHSKIFDLLFRKNILLLVSFSLLAYCSPAQVFQATIQNEDHDLVFLLRALPGGGDITTQWTDTEFFVRWPDGSPDFNFGTITVNDSDFPGVSIPNNGRDVQDSEAGYTNNWFGTSFSATASRTYTAGVSYEIFRVTLDIPADDVDFELVHNSLFSPHYLALISGTGSDLTNAPGLVFYGNNALISTPNRPVSTPGANHVAGATGAVLPVELFRFEAIHLEEGVQLNWSTASELNNLGFKVERRLEHEDWTKIGFVDGQGNTSDITSYDFMDRDPKTGNHYYRLRQIDHDGTFEFSDIRVVDIPHAELEWSVYPNPARDVATIQIPGEAEQLYLKVMDISGRTVFEQIMASKKTLQRIEIQDWPSGTYLVQLRIADRVSSQKLHIQK